jgi:hypothetical protein
VAEKRPYFACDDYGMGGIWLLIDARSAAEIEERFPALKAFEQPPDFLSDEERERIASELRFDIDAAPTGYLADLVANRE